MKKCDECLNPIGPEGYLNKINEEGGYGRPAHWVCDGCMPLYKEALDERFGPEFYSEWEITVAQERGTPAQH